MAEEKRNRRQIDRIEVKVTSICTMLHGEGETIGMKDKVNIMWGYRNLFIGLFSVNIVSMISIVIALMNMGN